MKSKELFEAIGYIDERYLDMIDAPETEMYSMKDNHKRLLSRRTLSIMLAAVICISLLTVTAVAAGWIPNIFAAVKPASKEDADILESAIQAIQTQEPETVTVPEVDFTQFTLFERYYDGESILLGYDLSKILPDPIVGYQPDTELFQKITEMKEYEHTPFPVQTNDTLEQQLELGIIDREEYESILNSRTMYARNYDLRNYWQIMMDLDMKNTLSPEQYEQFWSILTETGACCVAVPAKPWVGDHISVNNTDCGEVLGADCWNYRSDYTTDVGDCILLKPIPDAARNLDSVTVGLTLRSGWYYWYMELEGDVYSYFESNSPYEAAFTLENVTK